MKRFKSLTRLALSLSLAGVAYAQAPPSVNTQVSLDPQGQISATTTVSRPGPGFNSTRVIVRFRAGTNFLPGSGNARVLSADRNTHLVDLPPGLSVADTVAQYRNNPNVVFAEPDFEVNAIATPNDPAYMANLQWDMTKISAPAAWDVSSNNSNGIVAIVDTGIDFTHPDLIGNLYNGPGGLHGYNCIGGTCVPGGQDDFGHGTHVAGTIGAVTNNSVGMAGINWQVKLMAVKFLDANGSGNISDAVAAFNLIATLKATVNIRVTNNSWGGGGYSQALKDAMAAVEALGIVDVCAAGNNGQNADFAPMYPGAYDNRGIISVLASDGNDLGAGFTNFGTASVDLAAPGVNTYSTVPIGGCALCDPTGYRLLSGTSMATPHVAGVVAMMLHLAPTMTAAQARDAILDPGSYDTLSDARAKTTSTGGRLNYFKAITNPKWFAGNPFPALNNFPAVSAGADVFAPAGTLVTLNATATDPDAGDTLSLSWGKPSSSVWLFGNPLDLLFPNPASNGFSFTTGSASLDTTMQYGASASDGRGGGASASKFVTVSKAGGAGSLTGTLTVPAAAVVGATVNISFPTNDSAGLPVVWDLWTAGQGGANGNCCFSGSSTSRTFPSAGVFRVGVQAIDQALNISTRYSAVISVGGAAGVPPIASATLNGNAVNAIAGTAPFAVNIDMGASTDPDGSIQYYFMGCGGGGFTAGSSSPTATCTYTDPGTYWMLLQVQDNAGLMDIISKYIVVKPVGGGGPPPDTTPPAVALTNPTAGSNLSGIVNLQATASDASGIQSVGYHLDSPAGTLLGTSSTGPNYTVPWNTAGVAAGAHTLYAIATDNAPAHNVGTSAGVSVNVNVILPTVTLSPAGTVNWARKSTQNLSATVTPGNLPVQRVDFVASGAVICSDTTAPYSCAWTLPAAKKTYQVQAKVYDSLGNFTASAVLTVSAN